MAACTTQAARAGVTPALASLLATLCLLPALAAVLSAAPPAEAATVLRGFGAAAPFPPLTEAHTATWDGILTELKPEVLRLDVKWWMIEPRQGDYDDAYIARVAATVTEFRSRGVQVVIQIDEVPPWASDTSFWKNPITGEPANVFRPYYPMRADMLPAFQACMEYFSAALQGQVLAYLCWNEPNNCWFFYPQTTASDEQFAARTYARMLQAFAAGVRAGDPMAKVVAGETAPSGRNNRLNTSPQRFARALKSFGAAKHFDVYSHHPYAIGGTRKIAPEDPPADPTRTVSLGNLKTLLGIYPGKPFYLTEYGYQTAYSTLFGVYVSEPTQAAYLRRAYKLAAKHKQVKMLLWWTVRDRSSTGTYSDKRGAYLGLQRINGSRKPAYYVFSRGNSMTLSAPARIRRADGLTLTGVIRNRNMETMGGAKLLAQRKTSTGWKTVKTVRSNSDGTYSVRVWPTAAARWRVNWQGVLTSPTRWVAVKG